MGWFSKDVCPTCGGDLSLQADFMNYYLTCHSCNRKARKEDKEKKAQEQKIKDLEARLQALEENK